MSISVFRATLDHLDQLVPLFDAYRVFYQYPSDLQGCRAFLQERLTKEDSVIYLATDSTDKDKAVGFVQLYPSFTSLGMKRLWVLNDLFVHQEARKRGVGSALIAQCRELARSTGAKGLQLETSADNHTAQRLYEQIGFTRIDSYFYFLTV